MIIDLPGLYRWTRDVELPGPLFWEPHSAGSIVEVTEVDAPGHKIYGPKLSGWQNWDQPLEPVAKDEEQYRGR